MNNLIMPLPEAIDGKPWIVKQGPGSCDTVGRVLTIPTDSRESSRFIRNHELGHAKITPRVRAHKQCETFGVSPDSLQTCEDMRVHRFLRRTGVEMCGSFDTDDDADMVVRKWMHSDRQLALYLVATTHTHDHDRFIRALERHLEEPRIANMRRLTHLVATRMACGRGLDRPIGFRNGTIPAARLFDAVFPESGSPSELPLNLSDMPRGGRNVRWGRMLIEKLPMASSRAIPQRSRIRRFDDHGSVLGAVHRLTTDGRIFIHKKRAVGGTVLVDMSGSMRLTSADLEKIVDTAPLATVAIYAGHGTYGVLSVVASKGRMATRSVLRDARYRRGNIVDGPALRWLAQQQEPRIWISDGCVTGTRDRPSLDLTVDAIHICGRAGIRRVSNTEGVCRLLESEARNARSPKEETR